MKDLKKTYSRYISMPVLIYDIVKELGFTISVGDLLDLHKYELSVGGLFDIKFDDGAPLCQSFDYGYAVTSYDQGVLRRIYVTPIGENKFRINVYIYEDVVDEDGCVETKEFNVFSSLFEITKEEEKNNNSLFKEHCLLLKTV